MQSLQSVEPCRVLQARLAGACLQCPLGPDCISVSVMFCSMRSLEDSSGPDSPVTPPVTSRPPRTGGEHLNRQVSRLHSSPRRADTFPKPSSSHSRPLTVELPSFQPDSPVFRTGLHQVFNFLTPCTLLHSWSTRPHLSLHGPSAVS